MRPLRGFSLIEVVVAIFLVGLLVVLSGAVLVAAPLARHVKFENTALTVAAGELERLRALGYETLPASGPFNDTLLADLPQGSGAVDIASYNDRTKQVTVTVVWRENNATATSTVALTTLVTEIGGLP